VVILSLHEVFVHLKVDTEIRSDRLEAMVLAGVVCLLLDAETVVVRVWHELSVYFAVVTLTCVD